MIRLYKDHKISISKLRIILKKPYKTSMFLRKTLLRKSFSTFQKTSMNQPFINQALVGRENFQFKQPVAHTLGQKEEVR